MGRGGGRHGGGGGFGGRRSGGGGGFGGGAAKKPSVPSSGAPQHRPNSTIGSGGGAHKPNTINTGGNHSNNISVNKHNTNVGVNTHHNTVVVNKHTNVVVAPRPVYRPPPIGAALMTGMIVGATTALMIGAMSRRGRAQHKEQGTKIIIVQPYPGTLIAIHEQNQPAYFLTLPLNQPVPNDVAVVLRPGQKGTAVQITNKNHIDYKVIPPGNQLPTGANIKYIITELAPGTLVQFVENGVVVQTIIPPGLQIPEGSVVLQRPDGKPPAGTLVTIQKDGKTIQQIIYPGFPIPEGAVVIPTSYHPPNPSSHSHASAPGVPPPPTGVSVDATLPPPPTGVVLDANVPSSPDVAKKLESEEGAIELSGPVFDPTTIQPYAPLPDYVPLHTLPPQEFKPEDVPKDLYDPAPAPGGAYPPAPGGAYPPSPGPYAPAPSAYYPPPPGGGYGAYPPAPGGGYPPPPGSGYPPAPGGAYPPAPGGAYPSAPVAAYPPPPGGAYSPAPASAPQPSTPAPSSNAEKRNSVKKSQPPAWVPDAACVACTKCHSPFSLTTRRHHCRNCGKIFCKNCSPGFLTLPEYNFNEPVRVCDLCYEVITNKKAPHAEGGCSVM